MNARNILIAAAILLAAGVAHARKSPYDGRLEVNNERAYPVTIRIDGEALGRVAPRSRRVVSHVPNGVRFVELGCRVGGNQEEKVSVPVRGLARLRVAPVTGHAEVYNDTGTRMKVWIAGERRVFLRSGAHYTTGELRPGKHRIELRPVVEPFAGGPAMKRSVRIIAGRDVPVRFGTYAASLTVRNPIRHRVRLYVDGRRTDTLRGDAQQTLTGQIPGTHTLELRHHGRTVARHRITLKPGERARWTPKRPARRSGDLLVRNDSRRDVTILLDGREVADLHPRGRELVRGVNRGHHTVTVVYANGRRIDHHVDVDSRREEFAVGRGPRPTSSRYASAW